MVRRWLAGALVGLSGLAACQLVSGLDDVAIRARANGKSCTAGWECVSTFCVDGVCCDTSCESTCRSCGGSSGPKGVCTPHLSGTDPEEECGHSPGDSAVCDGSGLCTNVDPVWSKSFWIEGTADDDGFTIDGAGVAVDSEGNVVLVGSFTSLMHFDDQTMMSAGAKDIFVVKLDDSGTRLWAKRFGTSLASEYGFGVAVDHQDSIVVSGSFFGSLDFGAGNLLQSTRLAHFVVKFEADGKPVWNKSFEFPDDTTDGAKKVPMPVRIAVDSNNGIVIAGRPNAHIGSDGTRGGDDLFIIKFADDGEEQWRREFGDGASEGPYYVASAAIPVAVDANDDIVAAGPFRTAIDVGGGLPVLEASNENEEDIFVFKLDAAGSPVWARQFGNIGLQLPTSLAIVGQHDIALAATFGGMLDLGTGEMVSQSGADILLAKLDRDGVATASRQFTGSKVQVTSTVSVDSAGSLFLAGFFRGTGLDFGGGPLQNTETTSEAGAEDVFVAKFDANLGHLLSRRYGGATSQMAIGSAIDPSRNIVVLGQFDGDLNLAGASFENTDSPDLFVTGFEP